MRPAICTDCLIYNSILVIAARAPVHVFTHTLRAIVLSEKSGIQQSRSIFLDHDKIEIPSVSYFFYGIRRNRHARSSGEAIRIPVGKKPSAPTGYIHVLAAVHQKSNR